MTADTCKSSYYIPNTVNITDLIFVRNSIRCLLIHSFSIRKVKYKEKVKKECPVIQQYVKKWVSLVAQMVR